METSAILGIMDVKDGASRRPSMAMLQPPTPLSAGTMPYTTRFWTTVNDSPWQRATCCCVYHRVTVSAFGTPRTPARKAFRSMSTSISLEEPGSPESPPNVLKGGSGMRPMSLNIAVQSPDGAPHSPSAHTPGSFGSPADKSQSLSARRGLGKLSLHPAASDEQSNHRYQLTLMQTEPSRGPPSNADRSVSISPMPSPRGRPAEHGSPRIAFAPDAEQAELAHYQSDSPGNRTFTKPTVEINPYLAMQPLPGSPIRPQSPLLSDRLRVHPPSSMSLQVGDLKMYSAHQPRPQSQMQASRYVSDDDDEDSVASTTKLKSKSSATQSHKMLSQISARSHQVAGPGHGSVSTAQRPQTARTPRRPAVREESTRRPLPYRSPPRDVITREVSGRRKMVKIPPVVVTPSFTQSLGLN